MATLHNELPQAELGHYQEHIAAKLLATINDPALHVWFGINYLRRVSDIDAIIWHEDVGVFVVEIKGVPLSAVLRFGRHACEIQDRPSTQTPQHQALRAMYDLKNWLGAHSLSPYMVPTVLWPRFRKADWRQRWSGDPDTANLSSSFLFLDDLQGGAGHFQKQLRSVWTNPPVGKGGGTFHHTKEALDLFSTALTKLATPTPTPSDLERLRVLEGQVSAQVLKKHLDTKARHVVFRGYPGTGKTFRLLRLGLAYAQEGKQCLFVCFNKVLASDTTRMLSHSTILAATSRTLEVVDIYAMLSLYAAPFGVELPPNAPASHDQWAALVIAELQSHEGQGLPKYDAILVDEAQDLPAWTLEFLQLFAADRTRWFFADGPNQSLYGETPAWLEGLRGTAQVEQLRRNFRNTRPGFLLAQVYCDYAPDISKAIAGLGKAQGGSSQLFFEFARPSGEVPAVVPIDDARVWSGHSGEVLDSFGIDLQEEVMTSEIAALIMAELEKLQDEQYPIDLLVLVPDTQSAWAGWARRALAMVCKDREGYEYIDYVDEACRRRVAHRTQVRLATFHSARGIEACRVLVLGIEQLMSVAQQVGISHRNLGYVVLSRALFQTTVGRVVSRRTSDCGLFIERVVQALHSAQ